MAIKPVLHYRNPDSTYDLNSSQARIVDKAIFDGGTLTLSSTAADVTVAPFIVAGYDGMVAISDASETLSVPADGTDYYLILHLEYRTLTAALANLLVVPASTWTSSVSKNFFVTFARFNVPAGSVMTDLGVTVDYSVGDWADKLGKTGWRSPVANLAALPTEGNRDGDARITLDTSTAYTWQALTSTWTVVGGALDLGEVTARAHEMDAEELRSFNGSGYVGSLNVDPSGKTHNGTYGRLAYVTNLSGDKIDLDAMQFVVNGHFVKTPYLEFSLAAKADRHDIVYLDVWREVIPSPAAETYPSDPITGAPSSFTDLRNRLEQLLENSPTPNSGFSKIEAVDSTTFVVTRWAVRRAEGVDANSIRTPSLSLVSSLIKNVDGVVYSTTAPSDKRVWTASSVTSFDGVSWGIPLVVIRRTVQESALNGYVTETRTAFNGERFIFDVCPRALLGQGLADTVRSLEDVSRSLTDFPSPSGFLSGSSDPFGISAGTITVPDSTLLVKGIPLTLPSADAFLTPVSSLVSGTARFDLIVLEVFRTANPPLGTVAVSPAMITGVFEEGTRNLPYYGKFVTHHITSVITPTESSLMSAVPASYSPVAGDPGLWKRAGVAGVEDYSTVNAIPIAVVSRRLNTVYNPDTATGRSGSDRSAYPGLPDNAADLPYPYEVLDLRHRLIDDSSAPKVLAESRDKLLRGELRTIFGRDPVLSSNYYGTQLLQVDEISSAPAPGSNAILPSPAGQTAIWSDAEEAIPLCWAFPGPSFDSDDGLTPPLFTWTSASAVLTLNAPAGMHFMLDPDSGAVPSIIGPGGVLVAGKDVVTSKVSSASLIPNPPTLDSEGNIISISFKVSFPSGLASIAEVYVQAWAVKTSRASSGDPSYGNNYGLTYVPDVVYRVEDGVGARLNVGPILKSVRVTVDASKKAVVSQADMFSASDGVASASSNIVIFGVASYAVVGSSPYVASPELRYVRLSNAAASLPGNERLDVEFVSLTPGTEVDLLIMYQGDLINRWVEFNPASKGVRGVYSWSSNSLTITSGDGDYSTGLSLVDPIPTPLACLVPFTEVGLYPFGITSNSSSGGNTELPSSLMLYSVEASSYTYWTDPSDVAVVGQGTNSFSSNRVADSVGSPIQVGPWTSFASVSVSGYTAPSNSIVARGVVRVPLGPADSLRVFYLHTPYQGISTGVVSTFDMKNFLHGKVSSVLDGLVTTQGPNTPTIHPVEITHLDSNYIYEDGTRGLSLASNADMSHPLSTGIVHPHLRRLTSTGLVRPDTFNIIHRKEDTPVLSPIYRFPYNNFNSFPVDLLMSGVSIGKESAPPSSLYHVPILEATWDPASAITLVLSPPDLHYSLPLAGDSLLLPLPSLPIGRLSGIRISIEVPGGVPAVVSVSLKHRAYKSTTLSTYFLSTFSVDAFASLSDYYVPFETSNLYSSSVYHLEISADVPVLIRGVSLAFTPGSAFSHDFIVPQLGSYLSTPSLPSGPSGSSYSFFSDGPFLGDTTAPPYLDADLNSLYFSYLSPGIRGASLMSVPGSYGLAPGAGGLPRGIFNVFNASSSVSPYSMEFPPAVEGQSTAVYPFPSSYSSSSSPYSSSVVSVLDSWLLDVDSTAYMGSSSGISLLEGIPTQLAGGQTVDAFYPVGRPLFRKTK